MKIKLIYNRSHEEILSLIDQLSSQYDSIKIIVGFITLDGINLLEHFIGQNMLKINLLILGKGVESGFLALNHLLRQGFNQQNVYINLGFTRNMLGVIKLPLTN